MRSLVCACVLGCLVACSQQTARTAADRPASSEEEEEGLAPAARVEEPKTPEDVLSQGDVEPSRVPPDTLVLPAQGASEADRRTTRTVREALMADPSLSFLGQNVIVTTLHGRVTLRGTVESVREARRIEAKVKRLVGPENVESQLEVTP